MDASGPGSFLAVMRPQWAALASVTAWLEAAAHVIFSLQLGPGVLTTYGGYNKFGHSLFGHFCWVILSVLLVFSLRGVADSAGILQLPAPAAESVWPNSSAVARAARTAASAARSGSGKPYGSRHPPPASARCPRSAYAAAATSHRPAHTPARRRAHSS